MGMHHGILAVEVSAADLLAALERLTGEFKVVGPPASIERLDLESDDDGFGLGIAEAGGKTYVLDRSLVLSSDADLIASLSQDLGGVVAGAGAETTSGSYWFVSARNGEIERIHHNSYWGQDAPFDVGEPLGSEELDPLEDLDGVGLRAALGWLGFDPTAIETKPLTPYRWSFDRPPSKGPHGERFASFWEEHKKDDHGKPPEPAVIKRSGGGFDLGPPESRLPRGETGHEPRPQGIEETPSLTARVGRLFGRR